MAVNGMLDMYKTTKKRAVDPNAPPRPTLLGHEKVLKDAKLNMEQQALMIAQLTQRVEELERRLRHQTAYLNAVHQKLNSRRS